MFNVIRYKLNVIIFNYIYLIKQMFLSEIYMVKRTEKAQFMIKYLMKDDYSFMLRVN